MINHAYLQHNWKQLLSHSEASKTCGEELVRLYSGSDRHYHNLEHIQALLQFVGTYESILSDPDALRMAVWYHDAVYDARATDNEEQSATLAHKRLLEMDVVPETIERSVALILATKEHVSNPNKPDFDLDFLLDIDLSILSASPELYANYTRQIRAEYHMYTAAEYAKGRAHVLQHFLQMDQIYKTELFCDLWENQARINLKQELDRLL